MDLSIHPFGMTFFFTIETMSLTKMTSPLSLQTNGLLKMKFEDDTVLLSQLSLPSNDQLPLIPWTIFLTFNNKAYHIRYQHSMASFHQMLELLQPTHHLPQLLSILNQSMKSFLII